MISYILRRLVSVEVLLVASAIAGEVATTRANNVDNIGELVSTQLVIASLLFATHLTLVFPTLLALVLVIAAILGAWLWKLGPGVNFIGAAAFGLCGTLVYLIALRKPPSLSSRAQSRDL